MNNSIIIVLSIIFKYKIRKLRYKPMGVTKLTHDQVKELRALKGLKNGDNRFFDMIESIYKDNEEVMKDIAKCREIHDSVDDIETWPAHEKTKSLFYQYMDDLLNKIGYTAE